MRIFLPAILLAFSSVAFATSLLENITNKLFGNPTYYESTVDTLFFPSHRPALGKNVFMFDPHHLIWAVYNKEGERVGLGRGAGGKDYCPDIKKPCRTVVGSFTVFRTEDRNCTSKTFPIDEGGGAPMPHCMFFHKGYAIHGSSSKLDKNASHGCIRVSKKAAAWMNENYISPGAVVIVLPYTS